MANALPLPLRRAGLNRATLDRARRFLLGSRTSNGLIFTILLYLLLIAIGFVYLYPLLFMLVTSLKSPSDLLNPMVQWIPSELYTGNYEKAYRVLNYPRTFASSLLVSVAPLAPANDSRLAGGLRAGALPLPGQISRSCSLSWRLSSSPRRTPSSRRCSPTDSWGCWGASGR